MMRCTDRMPLTVITATRLHDSSQLLLQHHGADVHGEVMPRFDGTIDDSANRILDLLK